MPIRTTTWLSGLRQSKWVIGLTAVSVAAGLAVKAVMRSPAPAAPPSTSTSPRERPTRPATQLPVPASDGELSIELDEAYQGRSPEEWGRLLQHPNSSKRAYAITTLARLGGRFVPMCVWALDDPDASVRIAALRALGAMGTIAATAVDSVIDAARYDPSLQVRTHAVNTLGAIGPRADRAVPMLRTLLDTPDASMRQAARFALRKITKTRQ